MVFYLEKVIFSPFIVFSCTKRQRKIGRKILSFQSPLPPPKSCLFTSENEMEMGIFSITFSINFLHRKMLQPAKCYVIFCPNADLTKKTT